MSTQCKKSAEVIVSDTQSEKDRTFSAQKLDPNYVAGFVDGEGCFCIGASKHTTMKRKVDLRPLFEIELRIDDREILERIQATIGCGSLYDLHYKRYDWAPHAKYKVGSVRDLCQFVIPFFDKHKLQGKKKDVYSLFRQACFMIKEKKHLTDEGFNAVLHIRDQMRAFSKKHYRNR
ncbi:LAGLIDADG family homing endonuclease [Candidatus Uhrbacteria bacterium]|nr:LAGLIDADG family homing endonuclease [Candidatus Uhrbacteria bacterium]